MSTTQTKENKCQCGKELPEPRYNETGYAFCSLTCKDLGLEKERKEIHEKKEILEKESLPLRKQVEFLKQQDRNFFGRFFSLNVIVR